MKFEVIAGICECGCGQATPTSTYTRRSEGRFKGHPIRFVKGHSGGRQATEIESRLQVVDRGHETPCLIWTGSKTADGYGHVKIDRKARRVHVVMWERDNGSVPDGFELDHLCKQRDCANSLHCEVVTHKENVRRGLATKLDERAVKEVLRLVDQGVPRRQIARAMGVCSHGTINRIVRHRRAF